MTRNPPGIMMALGILFVWFAIQIVMGMLVYGLLPELQSSLLVNLTINGVASLIIVEAILRHCGMSIKSLFDDSGNRLVSTASLTFPPITLVMLAAMWWFSDVQYWVASMLPEDPEALAYLENILSGGLVSLFAICIFAPVVEEVLFRGIILRGFLHHYPPVLSVVLSATLFAVIHFNLYQFTVAMVMGCFLGWIYYKSRSLWPCIFGHAVYNSASFAFYTPNQAYQINALSTNLFTLVISMFGVYLLARLFTMRHTREEE